MPGCLCCATGVARCGIPAHGWQWPSARAAWLPATIGAPVDRTRGAAAGFDAYLAKPLDLTALAAALNDVLGGAPASAGLDADVRQRA